MINVRYRLADYTVIEFLVWRFWIQRCFSIFNI